jgi:NitT/TauT family transport system ATP-binding protein/sulfonate transport system ATP-binding protein
MTMVLVTHDLEEAIYLADRVLILPKIKGDPIRTIEVTLPRPRERSSTEFVVLRQQLMAEFGLH